MSDRLASRPSGPEALAIVAALLLAGLSTQVEWTAVSSSCRNTDVTRGLGEASGDVPWHVLYLLGTVAAAGSALLRPRLALTVLALAAVVSAISLGASVAALSEPFEALPPTSAGGPVGVSCGFDLVTGFWVGAAAVVCVALAFVLRLRRGSAGA